MKKIFPLVMCLCFVVSFKSMGQVGGKSGFGFLKFPFNAYSASMGGSLISVSVPNLNLSGDNPAALDSSMHNQLSLGYINYFSGINMGSAAYARHFKGVGTFAWSVNYLHYGSFIRTDATGMETGTFSAGDYALITSYSHPVFIDSLFHIGGNLKLVYSALDQYTSTAAALDAAVSYLSKNKHFSAGLVLKNMGSQLTAYTEHNREPMPFDIQMGFSKRMGHAPLRTTLLIHHMQKWDLTYNDPETNPQLFDPVTGEEAVHFFTMDKLLRHFIFGLEFLPSRNVNIRLGYNYERKKELSLSGRGGMTGLSFGFGIKISRFYLEYARAAYHLAGASNHVTLTTNLHAFAHPVKKQSPSQPTP